MHAIILMGGAAASETLIGGYTCTVGGAAPPNNRLERTLAPSDSIHHALHNNCSVRLVTIHVYLRREAPGYNDSIYTFIQMFKQGLLFPCSAFRTVQREHGHRARSGRFESSCTAMEELGSYSVYKAPRCGDQNS